LLVHFGLAAAVAQYLSVQLKLAERDVHKQRDAVIELVI